MSIQNRRAKFDYEIKETYVAGIVLESNEVKPLRSGKASIQSSFINEQKGEIYINNFEIISRNKNLLEFSLTFSYKPQMARVTVEDCTKNVDSLFDLVLLASHRAKVLNAGNEAQVPLDNDKSTVIALREIADEKISVGDVKEDIIKSYQLVQEKEEENEDHLLED